MSARRPNEARVYLRRSTRKQGSGIESQLDWAITQARQLGVTIDATLTDLQHIVGRKLTRYKHIYLDDGITGADLDRPGFTAFRRDACADVRVSHVLIHMPDRFARPEQASKAMLMEQE